MQLPRPIFLSGINRALGATPFQDAPRLNACRCPDCQGEARPGETPFAPGAKPYEPGCRTCGGTGLNRHREAA